MIPQHLLLQNVRNICLLPILAQRGSDDGSEQVHIAGLEQKTPS